MITDDTIVALSTANGTGAIAVVRISGAQAFSVLGQIFKKGGEVFSVSDVNHIHLILV